MITIIGLGFVGLTTALGFSEKGFKVFGIEKDCLKLANLREAKLPFHEPFLKEKLEINLKNKNFELSNNLKKALENSKVVMICVGTPCNENGLVDLSQIKDSINNILDNKINNQFLSICIKSTVPPTTCSEIIKTIITKRKLRIGQDIGLCNNPEFLREGFAWVDFINPDRIVIGSEDEESKKILNEIYANFDSSIFNVNLQTAEFIKYTSNTLLASLISFSNELEMIALTLKDIDIKKSFEILHKDKRWSGNPASMSNYVFPGCGFGGYCLPKDTQALIGLADKNGYNASLLKEVINVNNKIHKFLTTIIARKVQKNEKITILGLSFKPSSDDVRSSPACSIIEDLLKLGYKNLIAYDPISLNTFRNSYSYEINYSSNLSDSLDESNYAILVTAWPEFKNLKDMYPNKEFFDLRFFCI